MKLLKCPIAVIAVFALALAAAEAAERKSDDGPQWPNIRTDDVDFPSQSLNKHPSFVDPEEVTDRILGRTSRDTKRGGRNVAPASDADVTGSTARWPNVHLDDGDAPAQRPNPHPPFVAPPAKAATRSADPAPSSDPLATDTTASTPRRPILPPDVLASPYGFEAGVRYWYSIGSMKFNFSNNAPLFGSPTSTLYWYGMQGQTGEAFARFDHAASGFFVKGLVGGGRYSKGHIVDEDFLVTQIQFSETTSDVNGSTRYAMFDVGWAYYPAPNFRLGFFAGYHYWHDSATAYGLVCNQASPIGCPAPGVTLLGDNTAVLRYEPTWHAMRLGVESKLELGGGWSVNSEFALIPYASLVNNDSHLLRQDMTDLGPAPNIISRSSYAFGAETEIFVNYAVAPHIEIGAGLRYWGLAATEGSVRFGPMFAEKDTLQSFNQQRYGVLAHVTGKF